MPWVAYGAVLSLGDGGSIPYEYHHTHAGVTEYYAGTIRVAMAQDIDFDGDLDLWTVYREGHAVLEAHDANDDNTPDTFFTSTAAPVAASASSVPATNTTKTTATVSQMFLLAVVLCVGAVLVFWRRTRTCR